MARRQANSSRRLTPSRYALDDIILRPDAQRQEDTASLDMFAGRTTYGLKDTAVTALSALVVGTEMRAGRTSFIETIDVVAAGHMIHRSMVLRYFNTHISRDS